MDGPDGMGRKAVVGMGAMYGANRMSREAVMGVQAGVNGANRMSCEAVVGVEASVDCAHGMRG